MAAKRKRIVVSIETKLNAIERIEKGEPVRVVAAELKVGKSTVADWVKSKEPLSNYAAKQGRRDSKCKVMKTDRYEELNEAVFMWFTQQRNSGHPVSGSVIKEKAKMFASKMGDNYKDFSVNDGWFGKWKSRFGIKQSGTTGENLSTEETSLKDFRIKFVELTENFTRDQIFNCDETELNYKTLPTRSENVMPNYKNSKERITVLMCCNASGDFRLPLMCIGNSQKSESFKNIDENALPVYYKHHKNASMSVELFQDWFHERFVPVVVSYLKMKQLPPRAILFLDNAPSHPDLSLLKNDDIMVYIFPSNVTSLIQPINQGITEAFKRNYKRLMLQFVVSNEYDSLLRNIEAIHIKDAFYWAAEAWKQISNETLKSAWRNIYEEPLDGENEEKPNLTNLVNQSQCCENIKKSEVNQCIASNNDNAVNVNEVLEVILTEPKNEESDNYSLPDGEGTVSPEEGFQALDVALKYVKQHPASTPNDVMLIRHWRDIAARERLSNKIKTEIN